MLLFIMLLSCYVIFIISLIPSFFFSIFSFYLGPYFHQLFLFTRSFGIFSHRVLHPPFGLFLSVWLATHKKGRETRLVVLQVNVLIVVGSVFLYGQRVLFVERTALGIFLKEVTER